MRHERIQVKRGVGATRFRRRRLEHRGPGWARVPSVEFSNELGRCASQRCFRIRRAVRPPFLADRTFSTEGVVAGMALLRSNAPRVAGFTMDLRRQAPLKAPRWARWRIQCPISPTLVRVASRAFRSNSMTPPEPWAPRSFRRRVRAPDQGPQSVRCGRPSPPAGDPHRSSTTSVGDTEAFGPAGVLHGSDAKSSSRVPPRCPTESGARAPQEDRHGFRKPHRSRARRYEIGSARQKNPIHPPKHSRKSVGPAGFEPAAKGL